MSDWTTFGRVDADGTVYVKTAEGERVVGSWQAGHARGGPGPLRPALRRPGDRGRPDRGPARVRRGRRRPLADHDPAAARLARRGARRRRHRRARRPAGQARRRSPRRRPARPAPPARPPAPRRWPARPRWSRRPRRSPPSRPAGRPPATGSRRSSTSGRRSAGSTRRPTASCGSGSRPPGTASPAAAAPTSPPSTRSASRRRAPRRSWSPRPRRSAESTDWAATANRLKELMAEWKAAPRASKEAEQKLWETVPGRAGRVLHPAQRGLLRPRRRAEGQPGAQAGAARRGRGARRRRRPAGRAGQAARDPGPVARRRPGAARGGRRRSTAGCARSRRRSATRWTPPGGAPRRRPTRCWPRCASRWPRPRRGWRGRRRPATPSASGGRAGARRQAAVPRPRRAGRLELNQFRALPGPGPPWARPLLPRAPGSARGASPCHAPRLPTPCARATAAPTTSAPRAAAGGRGQAA